MFISGASGPDCGSTTEEGYEANCYVYSHIYNNLIHDAQAYNNGGNFLYSDSDSARNTFEKNIMYGSGTMALYHHCGKDNRGINNVVHRDGPLINMYGGCPKGDRPQQYDNYHNIYYLDNTDNFTFNRPYDRYYDMPPNFHHNLYWSNIPGDEELPKFPDDMNWNEWQKSGNDSKSLWQDPLFEDPASHRYVLSENSPAWELGIKQVDMDNIGIQIHGKYHKH